MLAGLFETNVQPPGEPFVKSHEWSVAHSPQTGVYTAFWQEVPIGLKFRQFSGSFWGPETQVSLAPYSNAPIVDPYIAWDPVGNRFVFCVLEVISGFPPLDTRVWWGTMSTNGVLQVSPKPVFSTAPAGFAWDYPSIAVNGIGQIIIGASKVPNNGDSTNPANFSTSTFRSCAKQAGKAT
jgi:hypothetical protein